MSPKTAFGETLVEPCIDLFEIDHTLKVDHLLLIVRTLSENCPGSLDVPALNRLQCLALHLHQSTVGFVCLESGLGGLYVVLNQRLGFLKQLLSNGSL